MFRRKVVGGTSLGLARPPTEGCWLTDEGIGWHGKQEPFSCALPSLRISVRYRAPVSTLTQHQGRRFALPVIRTRERALTIGPLRLPSVRPR